MYIAVLHLDGFDVKIAKIAENRYGAMCGYMSYPIDFRTLADAINEFLR